MTGEGSACASAFSAARSTRCTSAHLRLAEEAREALRLDEVMFVPAGDPWRKSEHPITAAEHRLAMLELAVEGNDDFAISDIELRREGPSYTADTLEALAGERLDDEFWFIVGADALADLPNWHEPARIVAHARLAVAPREAQDANVAALTIPGILGAHRYVLHAGAGCLVERHPGARGGGAVDPVPGAGRGRGVHRAAGAVQGVTRRPQASAVWRERYTRGLSSRRSTFTRRRPSSITNATAKSGSRS